VGRFLMEDCYACGEPQISLEQCEFDCTNGYCANSCYQNLKQCARCGRVGCDEHFDGMFCNECTRIGRPKIVRINARES